MPTPEPYAQHGLDDAEYETYFALMDVAGLLRSAIEQQLGESGDLTYVQFKVLACLGLDSESGQMRMTDLADTMVHSRSGTTYVAGQLERAGLVERSPAPDDERSVLVTITDAGRASLDRALPGHLEVMREMFFTALSRSDTLALARLLVPVRDHMRSVPPRSAATRRRKVVKHDG